MEDLIRKDATPVQSDAEHDAGRRDFFTQCVRGVLHPVARLLERRVTPITQALEVGLLPAAEKAAPIYDPDTEILMPPSVTLRPPGAKPPEEFAILCSRCGKCVEACPVQCIQIDPSGRVEDGFPYIVPAIAPCVVCEELACMKACPTGALTLVDKFDMHMGLAHMDHQICLRNQGEDCRLCLDACPIGSPAISLSSASGRVLVKAKGCVGCGMCEQACPTHPAAITVQPLRTHVEDQISDD